MKIRSRILAGLSTLLLAAAMGACHASGFDLTIQNNATVPLRNVEVDYPGAAFGVPLIAAGKSYWYHIKPTADGQIGVSFELDSGKNFREKGPAVNAGKRGKITLILEQDEKQQWRIRTQSLTDR
jgi:hypothetical protein